MVTLYYLNRVGDCGDGCCSWDESTVIHDHYGYPIDIHDSGVGVGALFNKQGLENWCDRNIGDLWRILHPCVSIPNDYDWRTDFQIDESKCEWC